MGPISAACLNLLWKRERKKKRYWYILLYKYVLNDAYLKHNTVFTFLVEEAWDHQTFPTAPTDRSIIEIKNHPCFWDLSCENYINRYVKRSSYLGLPYVRFFSDMSSFTGFCPGGFFEIGKMSWFIIILYKFCALVRFLMFKFLHKATARLAPV